jgi:hypothetical protein
LIWPPLAIGSQRFCSGTGVIVKEKFIDLKLERGLK